MRLLRHAGVVVAALLSTQSLAAQGSCQRNKEGNCVLGGDVTHTVSVTITRATRLSSSSSAVALTAPTSTDFDAGFGQTTGPTLTVQANTAWNVTIRSTQALWTASASPARANKPVGELQWSIASTGPFTNMTTTAATVTSSASATAGTPLTLYLRVVYAYSLDTPGTYTIPLQVTITAP